MLALDEQMETLMHRVIAHRSFEIHVDLTPSADDTFDVTFQIKGGTSLEVLGTQEAAYRYATAPSLNDGRTW